MGVYSYPGIYGSGMPNFGFVAALQSRTLPSGVTATWNGTSGSGASSVLGTRMVETTGMLFGEPNTVFAHESFHPYGNTPEDTMMPLPCLQAAAAGAVSYSSCQLPGEPTGQNLTTAILADLEAKLTNPAYGIGHSITETGISPPITGLGLAQARFIMRQYLGFQAEGISPIEFYKLCLPGGGPSYTFLNSSTCANGTYTATAAYTAIAGLMADIRPISSLPVSTYTPAELPAVTSYSGTYPLSSVHMVGARAGATANSDAFMVWQRSYTACDASNNCPVWITQASPAAAAVTVDIPEDMMVTAVVNLDTRLSVPFTRSGQKITFDVADDPVEILVDPSTTAGLESTSTALKLNMSSSNIIYGQPVTLTASLTPYALPGLKTDGEVVTVSDGLTILGSGTLSSGTATLTIASLAAGTHNLMAKYNGDSQLTASSAAAMVGVSAASSGLALTPIPGKVYGSGFFTLSATSSSSGAITYSVLSGPATVLPGNQLTMTGIGNVTLQAVQAATSNYTAAIAHASFSVSAEPVTLAFSTIANRTYGDPSFTVRALSISAGTLVYHLISGPATVAGNTVTLTGAGTVVLAASQVANANYAAATAQVRFSVAAKTVSLSFAEVPEKTYGVAPVTVSASSISPGSITYSVASGPATIAGNTVTVMGSGTVVLRANQAAAGGYAATSTTTNFFVAPQTTTLVFAPIATQTYGVAPFKLSASSASVAPVTYTVTSGPATLAGNVLTVTGAGTIKLEAFQVANSNYTAATRAASLLVQQATPALRMSAVPNKTYGTTPFQVTATSNAPGAITYSLAGGRATISGSTVSLTGIGSVTVKASQAETANYVAATAETSFSVTAETVSLAFTPVPNRVYGAGSNSLIVGASSASAGPVTYTVTSGPATVSANGVRITGIGTVVLHAVQPAWSGYAAATAATSFSVSAEPVTLAFSTITNRTYGDPAFTVRAQSVSSAAVTYTVISGPAAMTGNTVTPTGAGTVVLAASQGAYGNYEAATARISFIVNQE